MLRRQLAFTLRHHLVPLHICSIHGPRGQHVRLYIAANRHEPVAARMVNIGVIAEKPYLEVEVELVTYDAAREHIPAY